MDEMPTVEDAKCDTRSPEMYKIVEKFRLLIQQMIWLRNVWISALQRIFCVFVMTQPPYVIQFQICLYVLC